MEYFGHRYGIDAEGLHATTSKFGCHCWSTTTPEWAAAVILGLINYYGKFMPNLATILHPLNCLLQKSRKWVWTGKCEKAFKLAKGYSDIFPSADPFWPCSAYDASSRCFSVLWQWYLMSCLVGVKDLSPLRHGPWLQVNGITPKLRSSGSSFGVKKFHQYLYGWSCDNWSVTGD